jgi:methylenetetrahydrofolate reductase (NADPH)
MGVDDVARQGRPAGGVRGRLTAGAPRVADLLAGGEGPVFSFEFFPPKTDVGEAQLWQAIRELESLRPAFVSVTYGAGGTSRDRTIRVTERIASETTLTPVGHLTAVSHSQAELRGVVGHYAGAGVRNILALRGDPPGGPRLPWQSHPEGFSHAEELVRLVRDLGDFCVGVAAFPEIHPECPDRATGARHLAAKFAAGASFAITQFFFDAEDYFRLRDELAALGVDAPVVPGVMPVTSVSQIERFAELSGAAFPPAVAARLHAVADDPDAVQSVGVDVATDLCEKLLDGGAPGIHFITLNRSRASRAVHANLVSSGYASTAAPRTSLG